MEKQTCRKCKGKGIIQQVQGVFIRCDKCMGKGKLDWVEMIVDPKGNIPTGFDLFCVAEKNPGFVRFEVFDDYLKYSNDLKWSI